MKIGPKYTNALLSENVFLKKSMIAYLFIKVSVGGPG